ncbi:hypothetical protein [Pararobbsia silviterrae]|uniref:Uncharacterized protein n=1 Tax=Pararobbsia silviterrae TaxID=1792498 RepID=A0A494XVX0_9BURK|nr:hypothetical protein [Pararobbsia silviterrae]RKP54763.1 hypothetical protein D7S86_14090 [Pararobbsia silviterrae]
MHEMQMKRAVREKPFDRLAMWASGCRARARDGRKKLREGQSDERMLNADIGFRTCYQKMGL